MAVQRVFGFISLHQIITERHLKTQPRSDDCVRIIEGHRCHSGVKASVVNERTLR